MAWKGRETLDTRHCPITGKQTSQHGAANKRAGGWESVGTISCTKIKPQSAAISCSSTSRVEREANNCNQSDHDWRAWVGSVRCTRSRAFGQPSASTPHATHTSTRGTVHCFCGHTHAEMPLAEPCKQRHPFAGHASRPHGAESGPFRAGRWVLLLLRRTADGSAHHTQHLQLQAVD